MERKTLKIQLFSDNKARCLVDGEPYKTGVAKVHFGDWDKLDDFKEKQRRRFRGISHYDFDVHTEIVPEKEVDKTNKHEDQFVEDEFPELGKDELRDEEELEIQEDEQEGKQCEATTKSGKQCKNVALEDSDFCQIHQPKENE